MKYITYSWGVLLAGVLFLHTFFCSIILTIVLPFKHSKSFVDWFISHFWGGAILKFCNIKIQVHGLENIPKNSGGLYVFNHGSNLDILAMAAALPAPRFGAKSELFKIPFLSRAMTLAGMIPIHRRNRRKVFETYKQAGNKMHEGTFFALAPEGTRIKEKKLAAFKSGPFYFAVGAHAVIVPVIIAGAKDLMEKGSCSVHPNSFSGLIDVHVLPAIPTDNLTEKDVHQLKNEVREHMLKAYGKYELGLS